MYKKIILFLLSGSLIVFMPAVSFAEWKQGDTGWQYQENGQYLTNTWKMLGDSWYHLNADGVMDTGWFQDVDGLYYLNPDNGSMLTGLQTIDSSYCAFDASGKLMGTPVPTNINGLDDSLLASSVQQTVQNWEEIQYGLSLVNDERIHLGLNPLALDWDLCIIANYRSAYMESTGHFGHYYNDVDLSNTAATAYYGYYMNVGENIFCNYSSDGYPLITSIHDSVLRGFNWYLASPGHYQNMIGSQYQRAGIGIYENSSNTKRYFNQIFK